MSENEGVFGEIKRDMELYECAMKISFVAHGHFVSGQQQDMIYRLQKGMIEIFDMLVFIRNMVKPKDQIFPTDKNGEYMDKR